MYLVTTVQQNVPGIYNTREEYEASAEYDSSGPTAFINKHRDNTVRRAVAFSQNFESNTTNVLRQVGWKSAVQKCYFTLDMLENYPRTEETARGYMVIREIFTKDEVRGRR